MLRRKLRRSTALALAVAGAALAFAAQAGAATYVVSGDQTVVNEADGKYKMSGSLVGDFRQTSFTTVATLPLFRGPGTELFTGCLDRGRDGSCGKHDPAGTLSFKYRYVAQYTATSELLLGACTHPITGGTGGFARATGAVLMVDTPTSTGAETRYAGTISLNGKTGQSRTHARAAAHTCGA